MLARTTLAALGSDPMHARSLRLWRTPSVAYSRLEFVGMSELRREAT
jgi:hypothetical protein